MGQALVKRAPPDRSKIALTEPQAIRYWTRHLDVSQDDLKRAIEKVGNAAAAVKKELGKSA